MNKIHRSSTLAVAFASILFVTSAGTGTAASAPQSSDLEVLGSASGTDELSGQLRAEVNEASRNESGNLLSVTWSIRNPGDERVVLSWFNQYSYMYSGPNFAGITAFDPETGTRFHPIMDSENYCLCSGEYSVQLQETALPGETVSYWSMYSVPSDLETISVEIPGFDPIEDVPVS
ncbi:MULTISPECIES: hypothetical protein [Nocardiopsis]|uniref:hypothetical protein n=1 Tax=Nocardiopsis TaxID=2013 RepID=UPI0007ED0023|nr:MULTISPECIES: hypothetical protein [Nocardiopsis]